GHCRPGAAEGEPCAPGDRCGLTAKGDSLSCQQGMCAPGPALVVSADTTGRSRNSLEPRRLTGALPALQLRELRRDLTLPDTRRSRAVRDATNLWSRARSSRAEPASPGAVPAQVKLCPNRRHTAARAGTPESRESTELTRAGRSSTGLPGDASGN